MQVGDWQRTHLDRKRIQNEQVSRLVRENRQERNQDRMQQIHISTEIDFRFGTFHR